MCFLQFVAEYLLGPVDELAESLRVKQLLVWGQQAARILRRLHGVGDSSGFEILHLYVTYLGIHHILRQCKCMCVDFQKAWFIKAESWLETRIVERCELSVTAECI